MNVSPRPQEATADEMNAREKRAAAIMLGKDQALTRHFIFLCSSGLVYADSCMPGTEQVTCVALGC